MSATSVYHFGVYTLRPTDLGDLPKAVKWTYADRDHRETTRPEFWIEQEPQRDSYLLLDPSGPIFFFKLHRLSMTTVEIHIQFPPDESPKNSKAHLRVIAALMDGLDWLESTLCGSKVNELCFDSLSVPLIALAKKHLGFEQHGTRLVKRIGEVN